LALQTIEEDVLTQIESALERIEAGTYGRCQECGQSIMPERLKILPYATLCVNCQSAQEKNYGTV
jgi:RNA polymerase-binding transcription factor DksA